MRYLCFEFFPSLRAKGYGRGGIVKKDGDKIFLFHPRSLLCQLPVFHNRFYWKYAFVVAVKTFIYEISIQIFI